MNSIANSTEMFLILSILYHISHFREIVFFLVVKNFNEILHRNIVQ